MRRDLWFVIFFSVMIGILVSAVPFIVIVKLEVIWLLLASGSLCANITMLSIFSYSIWKHLPRIDPDLDDAEAEPVA